MASSPEVWVALLLAHDDGFEHGPLPHHKLDHPVDENQQVPVGGGGERGQRSDQKAASRQNTHVSTSGVINQW